MGPAIDTSVEFVERIRRLEKENADLHDAITFRDAKIVNIKRHLDAVEKKRVAEKAECELRLQRMANNWTQQIEEEGRKRDAVLADLTKEQLRSHSLLAELNNGSQHQTHLTVAINLGTPDGAIVAPNLAKQIAHKLEKAFA